MKERQYKWTVYMHTCPNDKKYIGITNREPKIRWARGNGYKKQMFYNAIEKYGWDNIKHEIMAVVDTLEEAAKIETELIAKYNTADRKYGYNRSPSTSASFGLPIPMHSEETKKMQSEKAKARPMETRNLSGLLNHPYRSVKGKPHHLTPEGKRKLRESSGKPIVQYEYRLVPVGIYDTANTAIEKTGINVRNSLHRGYKSGGFQWRYVHELSDEDVTEIKKYNVPYYELSLDEKVVIGEMPDDKFWNNRKENIKDEQLDKS